MNLFLGRRSIRNSDSFAMTDADKDWSDRDAMTRRLRRLFEFEVVATMSCVFSVNSARTRRFADRVRVSISGGVLNHQASAAEQQCPLRRSFNGHRGYVTLGNAA